MLLAVVAVAACARSQGVHTVDRDMAALRASLAQGRYAEAWAGLSGGHRETVDEKAFTEALQNDPGLVEDLVALIDRALEDPEITLSARVTLQDGTEVVLVLVDGSWVIESPVTTFYAQTTPREALESFIKAFRAGRWDVIAGLMPSKYSTDDDAAVLEKAWGDPAGREAIERLIKILEEHLQDEVVVQGNQAVLRYPEGQVTFMREAGRWVILDLD